MPGYKGHLLGGTCAFVALLLLISRNASIPFALGVEWLLFCLAGSLFPDVDIKSKGQKLFYWLLIICVGVLLFFGHQRTIVVICILGLIPILVRHRGIFHNFWFVATFPCLLGVCIASYFPHFDKSILYDSLFFTVGAISHLWLDFGLRRMLLR